MAKFVNSANGGNVFDRVNYNAKVFSDKIGIRMSHAPGIAAELPEFRRDVPNDAMPQELFGIPKDGLGLSPGQEQIIQEHQMQQSQPPMIIQQQMPQMQQQNPFAQSQYSMSNIPDIPISGPPGIIGQLINDDEVPQVLKENYWFIFHKDNSLTFLDEERKRSKLLNMDIIKIDILNSMPYYDYDFEKEMELNVLRNVFETKLDRALGYRGEAIKNERTLIQSQFSEQRHINEDANSNQIKDSFFKRLLGRR